MCLIAFAIGASQRWPLVIASNRDEFLDRPTLPLACWKTASGQEILSGRDLRAGGTWLGMTTTGRVAFLTNVREPVPPVAPLSRGALVMQWLQTHEDASSFSAALKKTCTHYAGFNLVIGDFQKNDWTWLTNRPEHPGDPWHAQRLEPGVYGLSNAALDTPWPKTVKLKQVLTSALAAHENLAQDRDALQALLWAALADKTRTSGEKLSDTGISPAFEEVFSSAFVEFPERAYGTRASSLLVAQAQGGVGEAGNFTVYLEEKTCLREWLLHKQSVLLEPRRFELAWQ